MFLFNEVMFGGQVVSPPGFRMDHTPGGIEDLTYWMLKVPASPKAVGGFGEDAERLTDYQRKGVRRGGKALKMRSFMILCRLVGGAAPRIYSLLAIGDWLFIRGTLARSNVRRKDKVVVPAYSVNVSFLRWTAPPKKRRSITEAEYQKLKAAAIGKTDWDPYYVPPEVLHDLEVSTVITDLGPKGDQIRTSGEKPS